MKKSSAFFFPTLSQPKSGFRYGIDSFLLARFAQFHKADTVCDLGAGVGIIGFLALKRGGVKRVTAVEIQPELVAHLHKNVALLGVEDKIEVKRIDWKRFAKSKPLPKFNVVISNPPYRKLETGKLPPETSKLIAKHEVHGRMRGLVECACAILKPTGRFCVMYPPLRLDELFLEFDRVRLKAQRIAFIHPYADRPATQVMVEAVRSPRRELKVEAPVIVYKDPEHYLPEIEAWVGKKRRN